MLYGWMFLHTRHTAYMHKNGGSKISHDIMIICHSTANIYRTQTVFQHATIQLNFWCVIIIVSESFEKPLMRVKHSCRFLRHKSHGWLVYAIFCSNSLSVIAFVVAVLRLSICRMNSPRGNWAYNANVQFSIHFPFHWKDFPQLEYKIHILLAFCIFHRNFSIL